MSDPTETQRPQPDLPSRGFQPIVYGVGAWTGHLHFAYDLVATLKPQLLVELGTDRGESYFCFCQSALENRTRTRCFAIDHWRGDQHAGAYDETTFREVSRHNRERYEAFSTLLRTDFETALNRFADSSIGLLHLDGLHTETAIRRDLDGWLPKLRPGGLLLLHDIDVRDRGFGAAAVWDELTARGRSFSLHEGPGLGVWQKLPDTTLSGPLEDLFHGGEAGLSLARYYQDCARGMQTKIEQHWRDGSIGATAFAQQTIVQVFHSRNGIHSEEQSVLARIGHETWKDVSLDLPAGAGVAPLRVDFVTALPFIDIARIELRRDDQLQFAAEEAVAFSEIVVRGDARRIPHNQHLRLEITGQDPQLYLPAVSTDEHATGHYHLQLRLRVSRRSVAE